MRFCLRGEPSEGSPAIEEDEDHRRTSQGDQGQGREVGNQVKVDAHGDLVTKGMLLV